MKIRLRRNRRLGETARIGERTLAIVRDGRVASWSPYTTPEEKQAIERWLADRFRELPAAEWPAELSETYERRPVRIASILTGRTYPRPWAYWGRHPRLPERVVIRAPAGAALPARAIEHGPEEPVTEEERSRALRAAERLGIEIREDLDLHVRRARGDPWHQPHIHDAPLSHDAARAARAAAMHLTSEHAIVWIRPTLGDIQDPRCRWTAGCGIGSHARPLPLSYGEPGEALERALGAWRALIREAVERIHAARGGTLTGWGVPVVPRDRPRLLRPDREGDLWGLLREDLARDPAPRTGLEAVTGLYADGTPYV